LAKLKNQAYRKWRSCSPAELLDKTVLKFVPERNRPMERQLQQEARGAQWLILWLDCDREGENIAFEVRRICAHAGQSVSSFFAPWQHTYAIIMHVCFGHLTD
jgi:DNA topoisomerase III